MQPSSTSITTANRVTGGDPSQILGSLTANGRVVLINRNGILFGQGATVDVAGLIATTHDLDNAAFMAGGNIRFNDGGNAAASVINDRTIGIRDAGLAAFVAPHIQNNGLIVADLGRVALGSGNGFTLDLYGDGLISFAPGDEITATLTDAQGNNLKALVENAGEIRADGGRVLLTASAAREVVNQSVNLSGVVEAASIDNHNGVISLKGPGAIATETGSVLSTAGKGGGQVSVDGGSVALGGLIDVSAGAVKAPGGTVDVKAEGMLSLAGGTIRYDAGRIIENSTSVSNAQGLTHGGTITVDGGGQIATSGHYFTDGIYGHGGRIDITADDVRLMSADFSATGRLYLESTEYDAFGAPLNLVSPGSGNHMLYTGREYDRNTAGE